MIGRVVFAILLVGLSCQQCTIGCLMCNANNQCVLCDTTNNYYLTGGTCALSTIQNCRLISIAGACVQCAANYYLDTNAQRCTTVPTVNQIANCLNYGTTGFCNSCSGANILVNTQCVALNTTIANCATYSANGVCATCSTGYILSNDLTSCFAIASNANCMYYSFVSCQKCKTGFINNPNYYFTNFNTVTYLYSMYLSTSVIGNTNWIQLAQCQPIAVTNCLAWSAFDTCTQCANGFFLSGKSCVAYPFPVINNCVTYSSLTTCTGCAAGYYLSTNACFLNTVIANCLTYSGTATTTTCLVCNAGFFLQGNVCVARVNSLNIANCQTVATAADTCAVCTNNFILTSDSRACLAALNNCASYAASTFQTQTLQCALCTNGFYLSSSGSNSICTSGTVANCQTYQINANSCTACINGYYLASSTSCVQHISIANCVTYDPTRANYCATCATGFYNFAYTTTCVQVSQKTNCIAYSFDGNSCIGCSSGYYLNSGSCAAIPSTYTNCATYSGTQCTLCNAGYMVNTLPTVGTCVLPLDYILSTSNSPCSVTQIYASTITPYWIASPSSSQTVITCATCNSYMYGYNPQRAEAICVNTNQLTMYSGYTAVSNCLRYGIGYATSSPIVCMQCASGWFVSGYATLVEGTAATTCVSTCTATATASNAVIPDDELGFVNICIPGTSAGTNFVPSGLCARYGRFDLRLVTGNAVIADYFCFLPSSSTTTPPTNVLTYSQANGLVTPYVFETPSATATSEKTQYYGVGYTNTVDSSSLTPQVFNFAGILASPIYTGGNTLITITTPAIAAGNLLSANVNNCDIIAVTAVTATSSAYDVTTGGLLYTPAAQASGRVNSCLRCSFGYELTYATSGTVASNLPAPSCTQSTTCASSNTVYGGLTQFLNSVLSCHVCSQGNGAPLYPTIWIETGADTNNGGQSGTWIGYQVVNAFSGTAPNIVASARSGFRCATAATQVTITDTAATSTISNCAVYGNLRPLTTLSMGGAAAVGATIYDVCLACAANYWPSYLGAYSATPGAGTGFATTTKLPMWIVKSCTPSVNCDTSVTTQFNSCGKCRTDLDDNITPTYYAFMDLTLSNCYQAASRNCFSLAAGTFSSTSTTNICDVCKAGFFLNTDNMCEQYKIPNQAISNSNFINAYVASKIYPAGVVSNPYPAATVTSRYSRLHYLLSYKQLQYGVTACSSGYSLFPTNSWAPRLCVSSSYVYNYTGNFPSGSNFINNCVKYNLTQVNSKNICGGCNTGYIPTQDGSSCVTLIPNCIQSQTGSNTALCYMCAPNYYNVNGACVQTTIANCATYVNTQWSFTTPSALTCSKCQNTFSLAADGLSCTAGQIGNCIQYTQGSVTQCTACATNYVLLTLTNNVYYCYPVPASLNCAILQDTSGTSGANYGTISCAQCTQTGNVIYGGRIWASLGLTTQAQTLCMPFTTITNCVAYSQSNAVIQQNSFACSQCATGYYYSASLQACVVRTNVPGSCLTFSLTADLCTSCATGTFLNAAGTNCVAFPNGIFQCATYSTAVNCTQCNSGYYLFNNVCLQSTTIANCNIYSANNTCSACVTGFYLVNSTSCVTATAQNCLTYQSQTACSSCATNFGLQTTNAVTNCVAINLNNCVTPTQTAPFTCLVCATGFYPNSNGVCTAVSTTIASCITYDTATTCTNCTAGSILNVARTACNTTFYSTYLDPNCQSSVLLSQPNCVQCNAGSVFVNGTCTQCNTNPLSSGCYSCNPQNQTNCLVCAPNYYMTSQGSCIANSATPNPTPNNPNTGNSTATITKAITASLIAAAVYFDLA